MKTTTNIFSAAALVFICYCCTSCNRHFLAAGCIQPNKIKYYKPHSGEIDDIFHQYIKGDKIKFNYNAFCTYEKLYAHKYSYSHSYLGINSHVTPPWLLMSQRKMLVLTQRKWDFTKDSTASKKIAANEVAQVVKNDSLAANLIYKAYVQDLRK
jgi:hypothetical protein